jgi:ligand-binding sensor domain-containing protein
VLFAWCEGTAQPQHVFPVGDALLTIDYIPIPNFGRLSRILRDNRGFLWFGTSNGLHKYDGYDVHVYENVAAPDTVVSLQNRVTAILNNPDGSLLLATWNGLWKFDPLVERFEQFLAGTRFGDGKIEALVRDSSGTLWIGTRNGGLYSYNTNSHDIRHYSIQDGLTDTTVYALLVDYHGTVWIGTRNGGLNRLAPSTSTVTHYRHNPSDSASLSPSSIASILEDNNHSLWVGTNESLDRLDMSTERVHRTHIPGKPDAGVSALAQDPDGRIWVGLSQEGIFCLLRDSVLHFSNRGTQSPLLSDGTIDEIYVDPTSTRERTLVWVGTRGGGVNKIVVRRNPFRVALRDQGSFQIGRGAVLAFCEDRRGILWVGTWGGGMSAYRHVAGKYKHIATYGHTQRAPFNLPTSDVYCLLEDHEGILWIGTDKGLCMLDAERKHIVTYSHKPGDSASIAGDIISVLKEDSHGILWICTSRGLSRLVRGSPNRFKNYLYTASDERRRVGNDVTDIVEDRLSNLWVTMHGGGLNKFEREKDRFVRFSDPHDTTGQRQNWMSQVYEDRRGMFWIWTDGGFVLFDPRSERFSSFDASFLQRAYVFDMMEDNDGHLWLATGIGLLRLTPATGAVVRYDQTQGFPFSELTSEFFRTSRGSVYVGGLDGFAEFTPDSLIESKTVPQIAITEFAVFGKTQPLSSPEIRLAYNQNFFSFSFASLDLVNPLRNRFAYRMEGVDAGWFDAGTRHHTSYTNLDPGNYVFRVKGSNSDGIWNEEGTMVRVIIAPPYWRTWWFALLGAAFLVVIIITAYRYRVQKLLEMQRVRLRIARDLHDDVGSNLGAIAFVSRTLKNAPELSDTTRAKLTTIYNTAVKTSEGMRDIVWFITPERDNIDDLVLHMKDTASSMLGPIEHKFEDRSAGADVHLSLEFRRKVFLAFKETLTNIVRHARATLVEIEVARENSFLHVRVRDNGRGFNELTARYGNGLANIRSRAKSAGGDCTITSAPGVGTTVEFTVSLREK